MLDYSNVPQLVHSTATGSAVVGVTCLGDEVFALRDGKAEVDVYDVKTLTQLRQIPVSGLVYPQDIASCAINNWLYICDHNGKRVYRVEPKGSSTNWTVDGNPLSLSITAKSNVLVTFLAKSKLAEFTPDGQLIREISLQQCAPKPTHSIQLTSGQFVVSHYGEQHRVCLIANDGQVSQFYGGQAGSAAGQLYNPHHLAVDKQGSILVADFTNNRVLLLSSSLTFIKELLPPDRGLQRPYRLCLDESRGLLYAGEYSGGKVSVFKL